MQVRRHSVEMLAADNKTWAAYVIQIANDRGHDVVYDGVSQDRWTCVRRGCGKAVLSVGGNVYGSAVESDCAP